MLRRDLRRQRREPATGDPDLARRRLRHRRSSGARSICSLGRVRLHSTRRRSAGDVADRSAIRAGSRSRSPRPSSATRRSSSSSSIVDLGMHGRSGDAATRLARTRSRDIAPGGRRRPVPVRGEDHAADARREEPEADACKADGGPAVHAPARRGALGHRRRRAERPGRRASGALGKARLKAQVQRVQGGAATCTWNLPADREGQDVPRIGRGRVRGLEGLAELRREGSLASAASATPSASRLSPRSRRRHRDGGRLRSIARRGASSSRR